MSASGKETKHSIRASYLFGYVDVVGACPYLGHRKCIPGSCVSGLNHRRSPSCPCLVFVIAHSATKRRCTLSSIALLLQFPTPGQHHSQRSYLHLSWSFGCSELFLFLIADSDRFRTIVNQRFSKPWMLQGFFRGNSLLGIVHEDPLQQVKHLPVERRICWDEFLN